MNLYPEEGFEEEIEMTRSHGIVRKGKVLDRAWKYCRIILIDFVVIIFLLCLGAVLNSILHILPHGFSEEQITLIGTIHFWYSVVLILLFPPFAIIEIIIERTMELKK